MKHPLDTVQPGDGVTVRVWTDADAYTVLKKTLTTMILQEDKATLLNGFKSGEPDALHFSPGGFFGHTTGVQRYTYERNPEGRVIKVTRRKLKNGKVLWKEAGTRTRERGGEAREGRSKFHDYNF